MLNDPQLLIADLIGDKKSAIDRLYQQYHRRIFLFARSYLKMEDAAADIVQEVFINVWERRHTLSDNTNLDAFIFTATRNAVISVFRKKLSEQKYVEFLQGMALDDQGCAENDADYNLLEEKVGELIGKLPPKRREVYLLSRQKGLSNKEIAQALSISEKTVEDHMTKALAYLRTHLAELKLVGILYLFLFCR